MKLLSALHILFFLVVGCSGTEDILAMLQNSLRVKTSSNSSTETETQTSVESSETETIHSAPDVASVTSLENLVLNRVKDGTLKGDVKLVATINASIKKMYTSILAATGSNQKLMKDSVEAFKKCKTTMWSNYRKAIPIEKKHWMIAHVYPKCITAENALRLEFNRVKVTAKKANNMFKNNKRLLKAKGRGCGNVCTNHKRTENYHEQLERLHVFYKKCKKKLLPINNNLVKAKKLWKKETTKEVVSKAKYLAMKKKCLTMAYLQNTYKCNSVTKLQVGCKGYGSCWKITSRNYWKNYRGVKKEEANMKIEWRGLKRIQCYLQVIDDKPVKDAKGKTIPNNKVLDSCIKMKRPSTKHLDIDYGKIPKKPRCPKDRMCPCSVFYVNSVYKKGPKQRCAKNLRKYRCPSCKIGQWRR